MAAVQSDHANAACCQLLFACGVALAAEHDGVTVWSRAAAAPASAAPAAACSWELRRRSESGVGGGGASPGASARRTRSAASHTVSSSPSK